MPTQRITAGCGPVVVLVDRQRLRSQRCGTLAGPI